MTSRRRRLAWVTLVVALAGCADWAAAEQLTLLTYNVWHGYWRTAQQEVLVLP